MATDVSTSPVTVQLGGGFDHLAPLYSYGGTGPSGLATVIQGYLRQTLLRDHVVATVRIDTDGDWTAVLDGPPESREALQRYADAIPAFLTLGGTGLVDYQNLPPNTGWQFYLPLGLPMLNQRAVQFLHFPPDYTLTNRDYLDSETSGYWEELLKANGVPVPELALYETVVDRKPIATDDKHPPNTKKHDFDDYVTGMLRRLLLPATGAADRTLPVLAGGAPARDFTNTFPGMRLALPPDGKSQPGPACLGTIVEDGRRSWALATYHPCVFVELAEDGDDSPAQDHLRQDLIACRWHVQMATTPSRAGDDVLKECIDYWVPRDATRSQLYVCLKCVAQTAKEIVDEKGHLPGVWQEARQRCVDAHACRA